MPTSQDTASDVRTRSKILAHTAAAAPAVIIGVGFFDFIHGQRDTGPNGIEFHPVLGFRTASCR